MMPDEWPATAHRGTAPGPATESGAEEPGASLRATIRLILTPARAGLFVSRDDLARLGSALGFPLPALDRRIMLEHLFMAAGPAGLLPRLFELLIAEADAWVSTYAEWEQAYPHSSTVWAAWRRRAEALRAELTTLRADAQAATAEPDD